MHIYDELQIQRLINGHDTMTYMGGSVMPPEVVEAMRQASEAFVDIKELQREIGSRIAELTHNPAAYVCGGAAAGLALAAAACMTKDDPGKREQLPDTTGMPNEIIVHRCQRNGYDHAIRTTGASLVEIGYFDKTSVEQLQAAISQRTAAIFYFAGTSFEQGALPFETVAATAKQAGIPVIVDAAAQLPPVSNLWTYVQQGAALVLFSGGKGLRGPQNSGLILGDASYVQWCAAHSCPNHGIGRSMKISKEDIVGLYAAVDRFVRVDHDAERQQREDRVARVVEAFQGREGVRAQRSYPARLGQTYPRALLWLDQDIFGGRDDVLWCLRQGDPPIELGPYELDRDSIYVNPLTLSDDEVDIVIWRLSEVLSQRGSRAAE